VTLRARVVVGMAVIALVLAGSSYVITRSIQARLMDAVDDQLDEALGQALTNADQPYYDAVCEAAVANDVVVASDPGAVNDLEGATGPDRPTPLFVALLTAHGETCIALTPNVSATAEAQPPSIQVDAAKDAAHTGQPFTVPAQESDLRYRVRADVSDRTHKTVVVALPLDGVDASVDRLVGVEVAATVAVLGVLGLVAWWVIHLGVRPVKQMTATATAIAAGDLSPRVPALDPETEAGQLGLALNQMLSRIERAFDQRTRSEEQLRQFLADASHELRTPVTTIRGYAELYQAGGLGPEAELDEAMRRTGQEAVRMGRLIDDMLLLARLDQGRPLRTDPVDVAPLVVDAARDARAVDPDRTITGAADGPLMVRGDSDRLRQVIANLVGNALGHTPPGTPVEIGAEATDGQVVISVTDHGPGMSDEALAHAFERFYRADRSRSRHHGGSGLGLAIVHAIVTTHGGTVELTSTEGSGATARVSLPLLGSDAPPPPPAAAAS
jgi:two-component system OmpR family sensor kinase